jgi:hypothetical protein
VTAECMAPIQGTRARIMRLNECGLPVTGAGSLIVFDGFVQVQVAPQYEDGVVYQKRRADGSFCVNRRGQDEFLRDQVQLEFCAIEPDAVVITTGQTIIASGATGSGFWQLEGKVNARWSLEIWQADDATCTGATVRHAYWLWPNLSAARINDFTVQNDVFAWSVTAFSEKLNTGFGVPGTDLVPSYVANGHRAFNIHRVPLPALTSAGADCGAVSLTLP